MMFKFGKRHSGVRRFGQYPEYDWFFALATFIFFLLVALIIDVSIFFSLKAADDIAISAAGSTFILDREDVTKTAKKIRENMLDYSSLPSSIVKDPASH